MKDEGKKSVTTDVEREFAELKREPWFAQVYGIRTEVVGEAAVAAYRAAMDFFSRCGGGFPA